MVTFAQFWSRLKSEFSHAPSPRPSVHVISVKKWSQFSDEMSGRFSVIYQGGNVLHGDEQLAQHFGGRVPQGLEVWQDYRAGRKNRKFIMHDLGIENGRGSSPSCTATSTS